MRAWIRVVAALVGLWGLTLAAGEPKFAGTWEATSGDKVFLVLKLQAGPKIAGPKISGPKISGTMNAGSIHMDDEGNLLEAGPVEDRESPIFFARIEGDKLEFDFQDDDNEVMHFELKLTADDKAELRIVDQHIPKMKAFPLRKK